MKKKMKESERKEKNEKTKKSGLKASAKTLLIKSFMYKASLRLK